MIGGINMTYEINIDVAIKINNMVSKYAIGSTKLYAVRALQYYYATSDMSVFNTLGNIPDWLYDVMNYVDELRECD